MFKGAEYITALPSLQLHNTTVTGSLPRLAPVQWHRITRVPGSWADSQSVSHAFSKLGVGDRTRTCIIRICNPAPSHSAHTYIKLVGMTRFERATTASQTQSSTRLSYIPNELFYFGFFTFIKLMRLCKSWRCRIKC